MKYNECKESASRHHWRSRSNHIDRADPQPEPHADWCDLLWIPVCLADSVYNSPTILPLANRRGELSR